MKSNKCLFLTAVRCIAETKWHLLVSTYIGRFINYNPVVAALSYILADKFNYCGIGNLILEQMTSKGEKYEPQLVSKFLVSSDVAKADPSTGAISIADQVDVNTTWFSVPTEGGAGGAGTGPMSCSLSAAQSNGPQLMVVLSMLAVAITGVGIIRRRKK